MCIRDRAHLSGDHFYRDELELGAIEDAADGLRRIPAAADGSAQLPPGCVPFYTDTGDFLAHFLLSLIHIYRAKGLFNLEIEGVSRGGTLLESENTALTLAASTVSGGTGEAERAARAYFERHDARRLKRVDVYKRQEQYFERLERSGRDVRALAGVKLAAVGKATAAALSRRALRADFVPVSYTHLACCRAGL